VVSIDNVSIDAYVDVDVSVDDIYEALNGEDAVQLLGYLLYEGDERLIKTIKEYLEEAAESLGYREVSE